MKRSNFGEADRLVTLYTKHYGKLTCIAKGIRKLTSRKRGDLEIFNSVSFLASRGKGIDIITETEIIKTFSEWRKNLKKVASAYEICEMLDRLTAENSEQEDVYDLLVDYLKRLGQTSEENLSFWVDSFAGNLLKLLGFWPKNKEFPLNFDVSLYIEQIIERDLKSKKFLKKI